MRKAFAVEVLKVPSNGVLTASAAGLADYYTDRSAVGLLWGVQLLGNTFGANGSIYLFESGGNHQLIWGANGNPGSSTFYPRARVKYSEHTATSGTGNLDYVDNIALSNIFHLVLSGVGNGTSGLGLNVIYI